MNVYLQVYLAFIPLNVGALAFEVPTLPLRFFVLGFIGFALL